MPVHWYYDRVALRHDYGRVTDFLEPREPHPGSILWRSRWEAPTPELDILGPDRRFWGARGIHYHRNLKAGENTLTMHVAEEAWRSVNACRGHDGADFLRRYIGLLLDPSRHRDTYIEECHRGFFTNLGRGRKPEKCAVEEKHVSGLAMMLPVALYYAERPSKGSEAALAQLALTHAGRKMRVAAEAILSLLFPVLAGHDLAEVIREEYAAQRNPHFGFPLLKWLEKSDEEVIGGKLSTACYVEDAVPAILYLALKYSGCPEEGLIANTNLGGDNAHRGAVLGALLGAANSFERWPKRWTNALGQSPKEE